MSLGGAPSNALDNAVINVSLAADTDGFLMLICVPLF